MVNWYSSDLQFFLILQSAVSISSPRNERRVRLCAGAAWVAKVHVSGRKLNYTQSLLFKASLEIQDYFILCTGYRGKFTKQGYNSKIFPAYPRVAI